MERSTLRGSPAGASPRGYPLSWFEGWMFAKWAAEEKAFQAKGIVQAKVWEREGDRSVGHPSGGPGFLPRALGDASEKLFSLAP